MLIAIGSDKGSPGTTTTALALASAWRTPAVVVEADPGGGDLGLRLRTARGEVVPETPTVLTLLTAARSAQESGEPDVVGRYALEINEQLAVVPAPLLAEQLAAVPNWSPLVDVLHAGSAAHFLDVGRLHGSSPLVPCVAAAEVVVVVARAEAGSLIRLRERLSRITATLAALRSAPPRLFPVLVGRERHAGRDVEDLAHILRGTPAGPLVVGSGHLAYDLASAERVWAGQSDAGRLARTALMRSAHRIAGDLAELLEPAAASREVAR